MSDLIGALKRLKVQTGSLACLGCFHEHSCGTRGCAIIRATVEELEQSQWISVTERLPKNDSKDGIIWAKRKQYLTLDIHGQIESARFGFGEHEWWCDSHNCVVKDVAFWMPAPKLPQEK